MLKTYECKKCQSTFERKYRKDRTPVYCSNICRREDKKVTKVRNCGQCGKEFTLSDKRQKFCNRTCAGTYNNLVKPKKHKTKDCKSCDTKILNSRTYCNPCWDKASDKHKAPNVTLGKLKESHPTNFHSKIRQHSVSVAKHLAQECAYCGYNKHVHVCHIKDVKDFSDDVLYREEVNCIDNLIKLCPNHHWEFDNFLLSLEEIMQSGSNSRALT